MTNADLNKTEVADAEATATTQAEVADSSPAPIAKLPPAGQSSASQSAELWRQYWDLFILYLSKLPDYLGEFFGAYQRPLTIVALILSAGITVYVTGAVVDAINDIPLLAPFF
ncbi:MAG: hypothetical protein F6K32_16535, partial [Desertifilum sp. SIO1I2]|nr:hypothetical protein [Desertifilum sp. SIO1I2]